MPVDPTLSLQVKPVQIEDPIERFGRVQGLRNAIQLGRDRAQQEQINAAHLETMQLANNEARVAARGQETLRQAYTEAEGNPENTLVRARQLGADPKTLQGFETHVTNLRKEKANVSKEESALQDARNGKLLGVITQATQMPDDQYLQSWPQIRSAYHAVDPAAQLPDQPISKEELNLHRLGIITDDTLRKEAEAKRQANTDKRAQDLAPSQLAESQSKALIADAEAAGRTIDQVSDQPSYQAWAAQQPAAIKAIIPPQYSPDAVAKIKRMAVGVKDQPEYDIQKNAAAVTPEQWSSAVDNVVAPSGSHAGLNGRTKALVRAAVARGDYKAAQAAIKDASDQLGRVEVAKQEAQNRWDLQMGSLMASNGEPTEAAKSVANYTVPLSQVISRMPPPAREMLMKQIRAVNPDFQESQYGVAKKTEEDATTGKIGTTSNAQNTALAHMDVLDNAIAALKNGNVKILNQIGNAVGVQVGQTPKTTFDAIVHKVGPELVSAYVQGGGAQGERGATEKDFDPSLGPDALHSNIAVSAKLLEGKIKANQDQYNRGTYGRGKQKLLTDDAKKTLDRLSGSGSLTVTDPDGGVHTFRTQAEADNFKKLAKIP